MLRPLEIFYFFVDMRITVLYTSFIMANNARCKKEAVRVAVRLPKDLCAAIEMVANRQALTKTQLMCRAIQKECRRCRETSGLPTK